MNLLTNGNSRLTFTIFFSQKDKEAGLNQIHTSFNNILKQWNKMSNLLKDVKDPSLFQRAFSPGLQEFIEGLCFLSILESSHIPTCDEILDKTCFKGSKDTMFVEVLLGIADISGMFVSYVRMNKNTFNKCSILGEVMRFVTNMVSKGKDEYNMKARNLLQDMYYQFIQLPPTVHRELNKKIHQHKGSMWKVCNKH